MDYNQTIGMYGSFFILLNTLQISFESVSVGSITLSAICFVDWYTYMDALTQMDNLGLAIVLDVDQLDVLMVDNDNKTFLYLH